MAAPIRFCERCGASFAVDYPSSRKRFCGYSCSNGATSATRTGERNAKWRGGKASHPLILIYRDMVARCERPSHSRYPAYGGRGIYVCARWRDDFWAFVSDVGPRPGGVISGRAEYYGTPGTTDHRGNLPTACQRCGDYPPSHKHLCPAARGKK